MSFITDAKQFPPYMTDREVARLLRSSRRSIRRWSQQGILPKPVKLGRNTRWDRDQLLEALRRNQGGS